MGPKGAENFVFHNVPEHKLEEYHHPHDQEYLYNHVKGKPQQTTFQFHERSASKHQRDLMPIHEIYAR